MMIGHQMLGASADLRAEVAYAESLMDVEPDRCRDLVREIEERIAHDDQPQVAADVAVLKSRLLRGRGEYFRALAAIRSAQLERSSSEHLLSRHVLNLEATESLLALGEITAATALITKQGEGLSALLAVEGRQETVGVQAHSELNLGRAAAGLGDHEGAIRHYDVAGGLYQSLGDGRGAALCRHARGRSFLSLGMAYRAFEELAAAYAGLCRHSQVAAAHRALIDLAHALVGDGRVSQAIELLHRVRPVVSGLDLPPDLARTDLELGTAQLRVGNLEEALDSAHRALDRFLTLGMAMWAGRAQLLRADVAIAQHKHGTADRALHAAEQLFAECEATQQVRRVWARRAALAARSGQVDEARGLWERTLEGMDHGRPALSTGYAHLALAGLTDAAAEVEHLAAANRVAFTLDARPLQVAIRIHQAQAQRRQGDPERAITLLRSVMSEIFRIEAAHPHIRADVNFRSVADQAHDLLITLLLEDGSHQSVVEAWRCAAAGKAYSTRRRCDPTTAWSPEPVAPLDSRWAVEPDGLARLLASSDEVGQPGDADRFPALDWTTLTVPMTPLVEFHVLSDDVAAFVIRDGQVHARLLRGATAQTRATLTAWQQQVSLRSLGSVGHRFLAGDSDPDLHLLNQLYGGLLAPLEDLLDGEEDEWHLVLHRHLHAVPFEALLGPGRDSFAGATPAVSFRLTPPDTCDGSPATRGPLVLAVPDDDAPLIGEEAAEVVRRLGDAELRVGPAAGRDQLLRGAAQRSVVHVACHGVFRDRNPLHSALRLGDGWVTAQDLLEADLSNSLVVLSACASGATSTSEVGPIGIAWACLHAGARAVVAAMWPVDDETARRFMERLYDRLHIDPTLSAALAATRAQLRAEHPERHDWAAFRLFSN